MAVLVWFPILWLCAVWTAPSAAVTEDFEITIRMPNSTSQRKDDLVCHSYKLQEQESYILRFIPHASMRVAHHMTVYGCSQPASAKKFWSCPLYERMNSGVCGSGRRQIVFLWANDAPAKNLPEGVGLRVGGTTGIKYLVVQIHYVDRFGAEAADTSGITLQMTHKRQPQQAGYFVVGNKGSIPPQNPAFKMESACEMDLNFNITAIGYRMHGHQIAVLSSAYRVRDDEWVEIGRMSPQRPQTFYNVSTPDLDIRDGDVVAARCTFNSMSRNQTTILGRTNADEMCKVFILYSTFEQKDLPPSPYCLFPDTYRWQDHYNYTPPDASSLAGIPGADEIRHRFNMDSRTLQLYQ